MNPEIPQEVLNQKNFMIFIEFDTNFKSILGSFLNQTNFSFKLFNQYQEPSTQSLENLLSNTKSAVNAAVGSSIATGIIVNPAAFFSFLNLVEMFSYILLFDIKFHILFVEFLLSLKRSTKLPSIKIPVSRKESRLPDKYYLYEIDSSLFISNSGFSSIIFLSLIFITIICLLGGIIKNEKLRHALLYIKNKLWLGWFYKLAIQNVFDYTIFIILSINHSDFNSSIGIFDLCTCIVSAVIIS